MSGVDIAKLRELAMNAPLDTCLCCKNGDPCDVTAHGGRCCTCCNDTGVDQSGPPDVTIAHDVVLALLREVEAGRAVRKSLDCIKLESVLSQSVGIEDNAGAELRMVVAEMREIAQSVLAYDATRGAP